MQGQIFYPCIFYCGSMGQIQRHVSAVDNLFKDVTLEYLKLPKNVDKIKVKTNNKFVGHPDCNIAKALGKDNYDRMVKTLDEQETW